MPFTWAMVFIEVITTREAGHLLGEILACLIAPESEQQLLHTVAQGKLGGSRRTSSQGTAECSDRTEELVRSYLTRRV